MNYQELTDNLIGVVKESQIKLGYTKTPIHLYFPADALRNLLNAQLSIPELDQTMHDFAASLCETLGKVTVSRQGERFCITVPEEGVAYVHDNVETSGFLEEFIACINTPGCTIKDVKAVFDKYSDHVAVETPKHGETNEFHYMLYFADGKPDAFRYCIHEEMGKLIYHRFTQKEFENFGF